MQQSTHTRRRTSKSMTCVCRQTTTLHRTKAKREWIHRFVLDYSKIVNNMLAADEKPFSSCSTTTVRVRDEPLYQKLRECSESSPPTSSIITPPEYLQVYSCDSLQQRKRLHSKIRRKTLRLVGWGRYLPDFRAPASSANTSALLVPSHRGQNSAYTPKNGAQEDQQGAPGPREGPAGELFRGASNR